MKTSTNILAIIFVVLLTLVIITGQCNKQATKAQLPKDYFTVDSLRINKIIIERPEDNVILEKINGTWELTSPIKYLASQELVGDLLREAGNLELISLISKNAEKQGKFSVDSTGTHAQFYSDGKLMDEIIVGKMSPAGGVTFVRKPNDDEVYQAKGTIRANFSRKVREWREKALIKLNQEDIRQIDIHFGDENYSIAQGDTSWVVLEGALTEIPTEAEITSILSSVVNLRAADFVDSPPADILAEFDAPYGVVSVYKNNNPLPETIYFAENDKYKNRYVVKKEDNETTLFTVYKSLGDRILRKKEELVN